MRASGSHPTPSPLSTFTAKRFLRRAYDELREIVMSSGHDWTLVWFLARRDGLAKERLRRGFYGLDKLGFGVTHAGAHIATFTAAQVDVNRYIGAASAVSTDNPTSSLVQAALSRSVST